MSSKNSLKNRIKKPNATQAFFNSYDTNIDDNNKSDDNKTENIKIDVVDNIDKSENKNEVDVKDVNIVDNIDKVVVSNNDETYVIDDNVIENVVVDNDKEDDYLRELAIGKKPTKKKSKKVFTSFYMDPDLAVVVDKIASRGEKGDKSKLINLGIRKLLEEYGVVEKK